jgi:phage portal protein BeeE
MNDLIRPKCRRCGGLLDLWQGEEERTGLVCNNPKPMMTDAEFWERWNNLSGDEVVAIEAILEKDNQNAENTKS